MEMFPYFCPKCGRNCSPSEGLQCSQCPPPTTVPGMNENLHPIQPVIAVPREICVASGSRNHMVLNSMPLGSTVVEENRKRNITNDQIILINSPNKQSRPDIYQKTDRNFDLALETNTETNYMPSGNCYSVDIRKTIVSNESQWNIGKFTGSENNAPVNNEFLNNESQWNTGELQIPQQDYDPVKTSDSRVFVGETIHSGNDSLAIPGSSGFYGNKNAPNVLVEISKFSNMSEIQSTLLGRYPEIYSCKYCGEDIDKHTKICQLKNIYHCCVCEYKTSKTADLQKHIDIHCPKKDCHVCSKEYTEGTLHNSQQTCMACDKPFQCRTQLDEHSLVHVEYFKTHCWGCSLEIIDHVTRKDGRLLYFCCVCGFNTRSKRVVEAHNETHRPKIFCNTCREEHPEEQKDLHNRKFRCFLCNQEFQCRTQLEDHYTENSSHDDFFSKHCRLCKELINNHVIAREEEQFFKCCSNECKDEFQTKCKLKCHLCTHYDLGPFKCGICGKRHTNEENLSYHLKICIPLAFKCETCRARFSNSHSLNHHHVEKHRQTQENFPVWKPLFLA